MIKAPGHRARILYSGRVQGVGFRITAERSASSMGLAGFVRNLDDGRVEVVCEGPEGPIKDFMARMASVFRPYIEDVDAEWGPATGEYTGFDIRLD